MLQTGSFVIINSELNAYSQEYHMLEDRSEYIETDKYTLQKLSNLLDNTFIDYDINYRIYQLIEDESYFKKSLKQVKRKLSEMNPDQQRRFTDCPIPKQILSEKLT